MKKLLKKGSPARFLLIFLSLFGLFYYFNVFFFGLTLPGRHYSAFLANHLDYISALRHLLLRTTAKLLDWMGYTSITDNTNILIAGHGRLTLVYTCLGLGIMSFFTAFVIAYPRKLKAKLLFLILGLVAIQVLNIARFIVLAIWWDKKVNGQIIDHHTVFNAIIYVIIAVSLYFWVKHDDKKPSGNAKN
ncbi:MAG TPA: archaeosortase/exosortase family protein [Mucilaginibacter sp.]|nr:archaeosortase/exosortase family protein [Mucilaginibacter sp.]